MTKKQKFSSYIIGDDKLVIQCGEILLSSKHVILAIISANSDVQEWARKQEIQYFSSIAELESAKIAPCDYLFSIINYIILPQWLLTLPKYFSINYHDALLPCYAGVHATSWALLNQEKYHGITWHVIEKKVDAGDILKQKIIEIEKNETALSLNLKCYQAAIDTFSELVDELRMNKAIRRPQDLTQRTYYGLNQKPPGNGWINWDETAENIAQLFRALTLGDYPNHLSSLKFTLGDQAYIVDRLKIAKDKSTQLAGNIVNLSNKELRIATRTKDIIITQLKTITGKSCDIKKLIEHHHLKPNANLPSPSSKLQKYFQQISVEMSAYENFWLEKLMASNFATFPFLTYADSKYSGNSTCLYAYKIPLEIQSKLIQHFPNYSLENILLAICLVYLYRINNQETVSVDITYPSLKQPKKYNALIASYVPFTLPLKDGLIFGDVLSATQKECDVLKKNRTYLKDLHARHPKLNKIYQSSRIGIISESTSEDQSQKLSHPVTLTINKDHISCYVRKKIDQKNLNIILANMPGHLQTMLESIANNPKESISTLSLLTAEEKQKILVDWNKTDADYPRDKTIPQLFEEQVEKTPDNIAVVFEDKQLTYRQLNEKANQLAHHLIKKGVKVGDFVAICLERSLEMVIGMLGILKVGAAYVPIDPEYPLERVRYILEDTASEYVLSQKIVVRKFRKLFEGKKTILVDQTKFVSENNENLRVRSLTALNLIYVIYTSGSTGRQKGVLINHKSVVNMSFFKIKKFLITEDDTFLNFSNITFDASVWEIFTSLLSGAKLYLAKKIDIFPGKTLFYFLNKKGITIVTLPPSVLALTPTAHSKKLRVVISAGEPCSEDVACKWGKENIFVNAYGPTETTVCATMCFYKQKTILTIGKPIQNVKTYVLNKNMQYSTIGSIGELYIGGDSLAQGYLDNKKIMKSSFINRFPIENVPIRLYRTGDLVRWLPDGNLDYVGRDDQQIKIRGFRVELGEIAVALTKYPLISQAIACVRKSDKNDRIEAYFTTKKQVASKNNVNLFALKDYLQQQLPEYMMPGTFFNVDNFPLSSSGKIDRNILLSQPHLPLRITGNIKKPTSGIETLLIKVWQNVLHLNTISTNDNFFFLGGDSILAMQVAGKARQFGVSLSVKQIFLNPILKNLASVVEKINPSIGKEQKNTGIIHLTPIQNWFFDQQFFLPSRWSQDCLLSIIKPMDLEVLRRCFKKMVKHHDMLRVRFSKEKNIWKQFCTNDETVPFKIIDLPYFSKPKDIDKCIKKEQLKIQESFSLEKGPLFSVMLLTVGGIQKKLLLVAHHLIVDGVSWRILLEDFQILYEGFSNKRYPKLSDKTSSYECWSKALFHYLKSCSLQEEKDFWLRKTIFSPLPKDFESKLNLEEHAKSYSEKLTANETQKFLNCFIDDNFSNTNEILLTVLAKTFENWTGNCSILIDMERHGRDGLSDDIDLSRTVGWFTSIFPLHLIWSEQATLPVILEIVRKQLRAIPRNGIGYGILHYLSSDVDLKKKIKSQAGISFNYWGQFKEQLGSTFRIDWLRLNSDAKNTRPYLIDINCWVVSGEFHISCTYNKTHYKDTTIHSFINLYVHLLKDFIKSNFKELENFPTLSMCDKKQTKKRDGIKCAYALTSMQKGMFFHALQNPQSEAYSVQLHWQFTDELNEPAFSQALQALIDRYDIFRSSFEWEGLDEPLQIVHARAELLWRKYDWIDVPKSELSERLDIFLKADRQAGFDFTQAPVMRLTLICVEKSLYQIILSFHHILLDGWGLPILLRELSMLYQGLSEGKTPKLPKVEGYGKYIEWLQRRDLQGAEKFWCHYLSGFYTPTDLSVIKSHINAESKRLSDSGAVYVSLAKDIILRVKQFSRDHNLTLSTIFQGLWAILLARYSQTDDVMFGVTLSTRSHELLNSEKIMGMLINTLPLRVQFHESASVLTCLQNIQSTFIDLLEHRYVSLTDVESWSKVDPERNLFQTIVVFENYPLDLAGKYIFDFHRVKINDPTHYPLAFIVVPGDSFSLKINYDNSLVSRVTVEKMMEHLQALFFDMIKHPNKLIHELRLLTVCEYQQILEYSYASAIKISDQKSPHELFEEQARNLPSAIALIFEGEKFTYQELNERSNQLAHYLRNQGIKPEDIVAICVEPNIEMIVGILGISKSGGAYLPIDPICPDKRMQFIFENSAAKFLLSQSMLLPRLKNIVSDVVKIILFDGDQVKIDLQPTNNLLSVTTLQNLMYVIYTSGSTGNPKGVMVEQNSVFHLFSAANRSFNFDRNDVWTLFHSFAFDFSVWEIWGALLSGGSLVIVPRRTAQETDKFYGLLESHKVTILSQTPSAFSQLVLVDASLRKNLFLKMIFFDGEVLSPSIVNSWFESHDYRKPRLVNMYGITEATVHLTYSEIIPSKLIDNLRYPIGKGFPGVATYILDKNFQLLPLGIPGELYIGGSWLARGYLDQRLTNERFIYKSFVNEGKQRLYKTGDLVLRLDNGDLDYLGRLDNQIKFHGFRIELDEITAWVEKYDGVAQAKTVLQKTENDHEYLTTYIIAKKKHMISTTDLQIYLQDFLPEYMVPSLFVCVKNFPLNNNGKIDTRALPLLDEQFKSAMKFVLPQTIEEKILAEIWQNILGVEKIGVHDNFFNLGGHSLFALQALLQIKKRFMVDLPVRAILDAPNIEKLAKLVKNYLDSDKKLVAGEYLNDPLILCVVPLQTFGTKTPLFLIHPVGGTVFWYTSLKRYFDHTRPLYGIQDPGIDAKVIPFQTMEEMARYYISAIRTIQPKGPYFLAGASAGGNISVEMAQQLCELGEEIKFVGLLDTWVPYPDILLKQEFFEAAMRRQYNTMHEKFLSKGILKAEALMELQWQRLKMYSQYKTPILDFNLTLFKAESTNQIYESVKDQFNHWEHYSVQPIERYIVPGDHETMFQEPYVPILAKKLSDCLNNLEFMIKPKKSTDDFFMKNRNDKIFVKF